MPGVRRERAMGSMLLNIGFGNVVAAERVVAVITPGSAPVKRLKDHARDTGKLVDATQGRRTRAVIVTDSDHVILSAVAAETITQRLEGRDDHSES
jgi:extracellular matrix regulatory protein A